MLSLIKNRLTEDDPVLISGFGQWKVREKKSRFGRNPKTKQETVISPRRVVAFYPSNVWREEISNHTAEVGGTSRPGAERARCSGTIASHTSERKAAICSCRP